MTTDPGIEQIETDIARTRAELAHTVDELSARFDVRNRAKERLQETDPVTLGVVGAVVVAVVAVVVWHRRR